MLLDFAFILLKKMMGMAVAGNRLWLFYHVFRYHVKIVCCSKGLLSKFLKNASPKSVLWGCFSKTFRPKVFSFNAFHSSNKDPQILLTWEFGMISRVPHKIRQYEIKWRNQFRKTELWHEPTSARATHHMKLIREAILYGEHDLI